jgi:hypothetical protein
MEQATPACITLQPLRRISNPPQAASLHYKDFKEPLKQFIGRAPFSQGFYFAQHGRPFNLRRNG